MTEASTQVREEEELSTADMAQAGDRPVIEQEGRQEPAKPDEIQGKPDASPPTGDGRATPLFLEQVAQDLHARWDAIQTGFVDNPRQSVEQADHLVAETIKHLAEIFANERNQLEQQWSRGDNVSTEDLRIALQRYRSFFDRLLSV